MSTRDLKEKYGSGNSRSLINRAIRAELIGGDHCLVARDCLAQALKKFADRGYRTSDLHASLKNLDLVLDQMRSEIRRRYQIPDSSNKET